MKRIVFLIFISVWLIQAFSIQVSGNQSGTWTPANNPYEVVGAISVPSGANLTIEPGVLVHITGSYQITVSGTLSCVGTAADSIRFLNMQANPTALWPGLRFENESSASTVSHTYIERGTYGIRCMNSPLTVSHCRINLCEKGMELYAIGESTPNAVLVEWNIIENCIQNGVLIAQNSAASLYYNEIRYNGTGPQFRAAIQLSNQSAGGSNNPMINNNHIHHNLKQGISAWDVASSGAINPMILSNVIEYNYTGIYLLQASGYVADNQINHNFIPGDMNSGAGVMVSGATSEPYFERNHIEGNYTGFYITNNAKPVLGDLSIYHAWAQGENVIVNNIDANGVLHSVFCDAYPQAANTIMAENNNWGVATADEIAVGINDHNDNAALPTVDYEPFLVPILPTTLLGNWVYNGSHQYSTAALELIRPGTGEVFYTTLLNSNNIELTLPIEGAFYAQVILDIPGHILYGCAGGYINPTVFYPGDFAPVELGTITVVDAPPPRYEMIGESIQENGLTLYPLMHGLGLYSWNSVDWVYAVDDYLCLKRNVRRTPSGNQVTELPDGAQYARFQNFGEHDLWNEVRVNEDGSLETQILAERSPRSTYLGMVAYSLTQRRIGLNRTLDILMQTSEGDFLYRVAENGSLLAKELILPVGTPNALGLPPLKLFVPQEPSPNPTFLSYDTDILGDDGSFWELRILWIPPAGGNWTHYKVYRNGELFGTQSFDRHFFHDTQWNPSMGTTEIVVYAWDGSNLSEPTNYIIIYTSGNEDELINPVQLSCYPNPMSRNSALQIEVKNLNNRKAEVVIYNLKGQKVHSRPISEEKYLWNGKDDHQKPCAAGIYFLKLKITGEPEVTRKLVLY